MDKEGAVGWILKSLGAYRFSGAFFERMWPSLCFCYWSLLRTGGFGHCVLWCDCRWMYESGISWSEAGVNSKLSLLNKSHRFGRFFDSTGEWCFRWCWWFVACPDVWDESISDQTSAQSSWSLWKDLLQLSLHGRWDIPGSSVSGVSDFWHKEVDEWDLKTVPSLSQDLCVNSWSSRRGTHQDDAHTAVAEHQERPPGSHWPVQDLHQQ